MTRSLAAVGLGLLLLLFAPRAFALSLVTTVDQRRAGVTVQTCYFDIDLRQLVCTGSGNTASATPGVAVFDADLEAPAPAVGSAHQHSSLGATHYDGFGSSDSKTTGYSGLPSISSYFTVLFTLDEHAAGALSGTLFFEPGEGYTVNPYDDPIAQVNLAYLCADDCNQPLFFTQIRYPTGATELPFSFDGPLAPGWYFLQISSDLIPQVSGEVSVGWSFTFDVQPLPEPGAAALAGAGIALLGLAGMLRGWTRPSTS